MREGRHIDRTQPANRVRPQAVGGLRHAHAHLAQLGHHDLEMLEPRADELDLAARDTARHEQRSGLHAVGHDLALRRNEPFDPFDLDRRRPRTHHLRAHAIEEGREVGHLGLARARSRSRSCPSRARPRHQVLGRARRSGTPGACGRRAARRTACTNPWRNRHFGAHRLEPRRCMSTLRLPMLSPPGNATRASPQRARSGPSTLNDARIRVTSSYGASGWRSRDASTRMTFGSGWSTRAPIAREEIAHHVEIEHGRHVAQRRDTGREQRRGHLLHAGVLRRARATTRPSRERPRGRGSES